MTVLPVITIIIILDSILLSVYLDFTDLFRLRPGWTMDIQDQRQHRISLNYQLYIQCLSYKIKYLQLVKMLGVVNSPWPGQVISAPGLQQSAAHSVGGEEPGVPNYNTASMQSSARTLDFKTFLKVIFICIILPSHNLTNFRLLCVYIFLKIVSRRDR